MPGGGNHRGTYRHVTDGPGAINNGQHVDGGWRTMTELSDELVILTRHEAEMICAVLASTESRTCEEQRVFLRLALALGEPWRVAEMVSTWKYDDSEMEADWPTRERFPQRVLGDLEQHS
jgi:hypothetical protein